MELHPQDLAYVVAFARSNPTADAAELTELISAKLGIDLTADQAQDIFNML